MKRPGQRKKYFYGKMKEKIVLDKSVRSIFNVINILLVILKLYNYMLCGYTGTGTCTCIIKIYFEILYAKIPFLVLAYWYFIQTLQ